MVIFQLALLEEAQNFLQSLPKQAYKKILYNMDRVARGEKNSELFKKLENSDIYMGVPYPLQWDSLPSFCFLGYGYANLGSGHTRNHKENAKNPEKRDCKG